MSDCETLWPLGSTLYNICIGSADIPLEKINWYRTKWKLPPLDSGGSLPPPAKTIQRGSRPAIKGCSSCGKPKPIARVARTIKPKPPQEPPPFIRQVWNLTTALSAFVADGMRTVTKEQYQERLEVCDTCEYRRRNRCMKCGCRLSLKAQGRAFKCPASKWPEVS